MTGRLEGKHAFVTGGASGIGSAIVRRFVEESCFVVFCDVDNDAGMELEASLNKEALKCKYIHCNVSKEYEVEAILKAFFDEPAKLDIVINNAAIFRFRTVEDCTEETWDEIFAVNVKGYAFVVKHALPYLRKSRAASIVNIGSISSFIAQPAFVPYNTCKGAVLQLTRCMAMDLAKDNIRVNAVCPGGIDTPATSLHAASEGKTRDQVVQDLSNLHLIPRMGRPEEVANAVLFLASDEASFITGHPLMVDGGWSVR